MRATQFFEFLRNIAKLSTKNNEVHLPHSLFRPMAAEDIASAVVDAALSPPTNSTIEIAGPDLVYMDEIVRKVLAFDKDPRMVIADPQARYLGVQVDDQTLVPDTNASIGATKFDWWLEHVPAPAAP